jgi:N-acetylmuramoyl-L-alanine amidase
MRYVDTIMVHCSATMPSWMAGKPIDQIRDEITRWHVEDRGWRGNGYAEIIGRDGSWAIGRDLDNDGDPWEHVTAGAKGHNRNTIHICLIGGHGSSENDKFSDHFTPRQDAKLRERIADLKRRFPTIKYVKGHNEVAAKACPGFNVKRWLDRKPPRKIYQSKTMIGGSMAASGAGVNELANQVQEAAGEISVLAEYSQTIHYVAVALTIIGVSLVLYARLSDWNRGRK